MGRTPCCIVYAFGGKRETWNLKLEFREVRTGTRSRLSREQLVTGFTLSLPAYLLLLIVTLFSKMIQYQTSIIVA
jgi:hypothetical protein